MATQILRPNADIIHQWQSNGGPATAWECIDDNITEPTNAVASGDGDWISGLGLTFDTACDFQTFVPAGTVTQVELWFYSKTSLGRGVQVDLKADGLNLDSLLVNGTDPEGWYSITYVGSLTQIQIDNLTATFNNIYQGTLGTQPQIYAAYIEVTYTPDYEYGEAHLTGSGTLAVAGATFTRPVRRSTQPNCTMGRYGIALIKGGRVLATAGARLARVEWGRSLDRPSSATINLITAGKNCCGQLSLVDHWNTDLAITVADDDTGTNDVIWRGPVKQAAGGKGYLRITAVDILGWLERRHLLSDLTFTNDDVSDIFVGVWDSAMSVDAPVHEIIVHPSGVIESRKIRGSDPRIAWNVVSEMLDAGLDVTTHGSRIIVGMPAFTPINMSDSDVDGEVEVVKDGEEFANFIVANASQAILATHPDERKGSNGYPLVEASVIDSQLPNLASAEAAAKARYDYSSKGVRRVRASGGLKLRPGSKLNIYKVLAGQLINFTANETCFSATETLRLGNLSVVAESGRETAVIELQPVGGVQGLATL